VAAFALLFAVCVSANAQESVPFDSLQLAVPDVAQAHDWYLKNIGGNPGETAERVAFGPWIEQHPLPYQIVFVASGNAQPSAGSVIDNIGFSFRNLDAKVQEIQAAGAKIVTPAADVPGLWRRAVVEDPWGTKLELVEDPDLFGFHHITLVVPNPEQIQTWYVRAFGGERIKYRDRIDAIRYRNLSAFYLFLVKGEGATPSQGHSIDHLAWGPLDLDKVVSDLTGLGVKFTSNPNPRSYPACVFVEGTDDRGRGTHGIRKLSCTEPDRLAHRSVYLQTPYGVPIEIVQHLEVPNQH
jgi:catechol 2,3-dioxygenase-like lactoylglutathione lyase family enzyme